MAGGPTRPAQLTTRETWIRGIAVFVLLFVFLVGIRGMGTGFKGLGREFAESLFLLASNPFLALAIGIFATTLVQSSSVSTSMIVALVAAPENPLPIDAAIPMIMGANIGTTVTNTIVSLGHVSRPHEFRRAFSAATCHDFFNFITVVVLLPLELLTGYLRNTAGLIAGSLTGFGGGKLPNPIKVATKAALHPIQDLVESLFSNEKTAAIVLIIVSAAIIVASLFAIVALLRKLAATRLELYLNRALGSNAAIAMAIGVIVTVMVQSSSITTSILIPLAGAGIITLRQVFPVTLGANVGTTITALLASMAVAPEQAEAAVTIAIVHLLFNISGIILVYPYKPIRHIPLRMAHWLSKTATRSRHYALLYVILLFYGLPGLMILIWQLL